MQPVKSQKQKARWRRGGVSSTSEHIELTGGDKNLPVARVAPPVDHTFTVEFLINEELPSNIAILKSAKGELDFYLVEKNELNPWGYAQYHCTTSSNIYSQVHWSYYPEGKK